MIVRIMECLKKGCISVIHKNTSPAGNIYAVFVKFELNTISRHDIQDT